MNPGPCLEWFPRRVLAFLLKLAIPFALMVPEVAAASVSEYDLKALYLYNFSQFVTWPDGIPREPLVIGLIGSDPFGDRLERIAESRGLGQDALVIRRIAEPADAIGCHILFICKSENRRLGRILEVVGEQPILTVGDEESFVLRGCVVGFQVDDDRVRVLVNDRATAKSRLTLSSKLLRIAQRS